LFHGFLLIKLTLQCISHHLHRRSEKKAATRNGLSIAQKQPTVLT